MTDAVERFRVELAKLGGDDEDAEGWRLLHSLFESTVAPYVNELELGQEAWGIVEEAMGPPEGESDVDTARRAAELIRVVVRERGSEDPVAALREGLLEARGVVRVVVEALGFPADVELPAVVARARDLRSDLGLPADEELRVMAARERDLRSDLDQARELRSQAEVPGVDGVDRSLLREVNDGQFQYYLRGSRWCRTSGFGGVAELFMPPTPLAEDYTVRLRRLIDVGLVVVDESGHPRLTDAGLVAMGAHGLAETREVLRRQHDALQEVARICAQRPITVNVTPEAVVARVRAVVEGLRVQLGADGGLDLDLADRSMLRAVGEGWVREVGECGALRWQRPGAGAEPFRSNDWARFELLRDAGLVSTVDAEHPYLTGQGCYELGRARPSGVTVTAGVGLSRADDGRARTVEAWALRELAWQVLGSDPDAVGVEPEPREVVARVRGVTEALLGVAALPGIEVAQDAVRGDPEAVLGAVRAALAELHEVREVRASLREGAAEGSDVVGVARVRELLRAADDLRELPAVGEWWARGARERERMLVAAWLVRRARMIVDAPVGGGSDGG